MNEHNEIFGGKGFGKLRNSNAKEAGSITIQDVGTVCIGCAPGVEPEVLYNLCLTLKLCYKSYIINIT